jgi:N-acetylglucosamine-6-sulfatase
MLRVPCAHRPIIRAAALATLFAASLPVVGCGGSSTAPPPAATPTAVAATPTPAPARPNIVVVVTDDLDSGSVARMPHVGSLLVQRGLTFTNAFATTPLCAPARASILTGLHPHNHGVKRNQQAAQTFRQEGYEASSLGPWLHAAGYRTALVGKYLNQYTGDVVPAGWDEWDAVFSTVGSDAYYDYFIRTRDGIDSFGEAESDYLTDVLAERAEGFIRDADQSDQPLFLLLATSAPHSPAIPAPRHATLFAGEHAPRDPSFNEGDVSDKPAHVRVLPLLTDERIDELDADYRNRLRCMLAVDDAVQGIIQVLADTGRLENTYFFFTSDNGFMFGHHRYFWGKDVPYEPSIRVPLIVRGPNVPRGARRDHMVTLVDVGATLPILAGATPGTTLDGKDLTPLLGTAPPALDAWRDSILLEHNPGGTLTAQSVPDYEGLRTRSAVFVRYATAELELYDLTRDPDELNSLHRQVAKQVIDDWLARLSDVRHCRGAACP